MKKHTKYKFRISRKRHVFPFIIFIGCVCFIIGRITNIPFELNWVFSLAPLIGFVISETEKQQRIKIKQEFVKKKFTETRFVISVLTPLLLVLNWIFKIIFKISFEFNDTEISGVSTIIALIVASKQGHDKSKKR